MTPPEGGASYSSTYSTTAPRSAAGQSGSGASSTADQQASLPPHEFTVPKAADLIGLDRRRITALLGKPVFVRRDPPAEFWRYDQPDCVLELIFYNKKDGRKRLSYIETRRNGHDGKAIAKCLRSVVASRAKE